MLESQGIKASHVYACLKRKLDLLASVMDLCSRKIVGYAYGFGMTVDLAVEVVRNAAFNVNDSRGVTLYSDHTEENTVWYIIGKIVYSWKVLLFFGIVLFSA